MRWTIENFKGLMRAELDLTPGKLTVLTGVNSSGKSSVLQSLLLAAQSLYRTGPVVLNGPLVRLGDAHDLVREGESADAVRIEVRLTEVDPDDDDTESPLRAVLDLKPTEDRATLQVRRLEISSVDDPAHPFVLDRQNARTEDVSLVEQATHRLGPVQALHLKSYLGASRKPLRIFVVMQGLTPAAVVQLLKPEEVALRYRKAAERFLAQAFGDSQQNVRARSFPRASSASYVVREFLRLCSLHESDEAAQFTEQFDDARSGAVYAFDKAWRKLSATQRELLLDVASQMRSREPYVVRQVRGGGHRFRQPGLLETALETALGDSYEALETFNDSMGELAERVQYLGPLRDEPRVVWNHWNELARGLPVGTRGEYSATVLSRAASTLIQYVGPYDHRVKVASLQKAVDEWLAYLDIGEGVSARSRGKLGVGLMINVNGRARDLTSVGVGVSQALPLVVALLRVPHGSLFIVEQPELHLHPAVQARLADFFLKARPGVTVIVETHSDSFVTRIRRRAAEGEVTNESVDITFVESTNDGARTRVLELTEFGDLNEWPAGFLTAAEEDTTAILQANLAKFNGAAGAN